MADTKPRRRGRYPAELRERAVRMVFEAEQHSGSQWAAICSIAEKLGPTPETVCHGCVARRSIRATEPGSRAHISRQPISLQFPAAFQLVACTSPCPCGRADEECRCFDVQRARYRRRLPGPLLDRFDLRVHVRPLAAASPRGGSSPRLADVALTRYGRVPWSGVSPEVHL